MRLSILTIIFTTVFSACDVLDLEPNDRIPAEEVFDNERGLRTAVAGTYDALQSNAISQHYMLFGDLAADNLSAVGSKIEYREVANNRITANNINIEGIWNAHYDAINRANNVIANIDNVAGISGSTKSAYLGEVLAIRALCYFNLVRAFGGVPLKLQPSRGISSEDLNVKRSSETEVYEQILTDLETANANLEGTGIGDASTFSQGSVLGLLTKVHIYLSNFQEAVTYSDAVMALEYELVDGENYPELFVEGADNSEILFQIDFSDDDFNELADYTQPSARFEVGLTESAYNSFTGDDLRASTAAPSGSSDLYLNKYTDISNDSDNSIVLRYADILLLKAEALNELSYEAGGEAFDLINAIRMRAGLGELDAANTPSQESFRLALEDERRRELMGEGERWFDLIRTGRALEVLGEEKGFDNPEHLRFPIPQSELDTNNHPEMTQNDDY